MLAWTITAAAVLLSFERLCYLWIWRAPDKFCERCATPVIARMGSEPIDVLEILFYFFKILQLAVLVGWCLIFGNGVLWPASVTMFNLGVGAALMATGQTLNLSVFHRLGRVGVFYGNKLGYRIAWSRKFPFSWLEHPQYFGTLLSIWGFFLALRFPQDDWYVVPVLETIYYGLGAYFER